MDDVVATIKQAIPIQVLIGEYVRLEPVGSKFRGLCPFHDDRRPSLNIDPQFQSYRCWACGAKGDVFTFLQEMERINFSEAKERLAERAGIPLRRGPNDRNDVKQSLLRVLAWSQEIFLKSLLDPQLGREARQYLDQRGLTMETARRFGLGFAPTHYEWLLFQAKRDGISSELLLKAGLAKIGTRNTPYDVFRGRLMFPIRDERARVVGFGGRILESVQRAGNDAIGPKYLNTPATDVYNKSNVLYGLDVVASQARGPNNKAERQVTVMEGYTDCLMSYQFGYSNAVASCGTALTGQHITKLRTYADRLVLLFDGDAAGQKAAKSAVPLSLGSELDVRVCVLPNNLDPCDYVRNSGIDALKDAIQNAPDALDYVIDDARRNSPNTIEGQRQSLEKVLAVLAQIPELARESQKVKIDLAISRVTSALGIDETIVRKRIAEIRKGVQAEPRSALVESAPAVQTPMAHRERQIVQWLICRPALTVEFRTLFPVERITHPDLRQLAAACYSTFDEHETAVSVEMIREKLSDPRIDGLAVELLETAPKDQEFEDGVKSIKSALQDEHRRAGLRAAGRSLSASASEQDQLDSLRRLLNSLPTTKGSS